MSVLRWKKKKTMKLHLKMVKAQNCSVSNSVLYCHIISMMDIHCGYIYIMIRLPPKDTADSFFSGQLPGKMYENLCPTRE
jgi:uncharacterized protein with PQ loop repeat